MENSAAPVSIRPGDQLEVEKLYLDVRPKFIPWMMDRYGISQYYAEEILAETAMGVRNFADEGHVQDLHGDLHFIFYSIGVMVADKVVNTIARHGLGPMAYTPQTFAAADEAHGINLVKLSNYHYEPKIQQETPLQKLANKAKDRLNPECQKLMDHLARTNLTPEQLAKVMGYSTEKGLKFMKDICMEKFSKLLDEEIANR